jgi:hypothetical protein
MKLRWTRPALAAKIWFEGQNYIARDNQSSWNALGTLAFYNPFFKLGAGLNPTVRLALMLITSPF